MKKLLLLLVCLSSVAAEAATKQNVLFIAVDDLNHWIGHLGRNPQVKTPNLDRLAKRGVSFSRAYCAAPACNPSRAALMSGLRPNMTGVYHNPDDDRPVIAPELTLNSWFRANGYFVAGAGKIYHGGGGRTEEWDDYMRGAGNDSATKVDDRSVGGIKFGVLDGDDTQMGDYKIGSWIIDQLSRKHDKPFFLACGFHKPHMPWNVPKKYFDLYPLDTIQLPPHTTDDLADVPATGVRMAHSSGDHAKMLASGRWKEAVQAYLAAISFADAQIGRVLDALDKSEYRDNTIICLWGDHGWHLGEKEHWRKFALWEEATRAPLIWVAPGVTKGGSICERTVDFMSIYPTLCETAGLPIPKHVATPPITSLLRDPKARWDTPALTTHGFQNHALRTERWRYIRYADGTEELYDHNSDPYEFTNLATKPESAQIKAELSKRLPTTNQPGIDGRNSPRRKSQPRRGNTRPGR